MTKFSILSFIILFTSMITTPSIANEVLIDLSPYIKVYKDGRIERSWADKVPTELDPETGVQSKDVVISHAVYARLFLPNSTATSPKKKLPLLVYFHGGGFTAGSCCSSPYHDYLNRLVSAANVVAVSVEYRLAPEHYLPIAYEDSWEAIKWVVSHFRGKGPDRDLNHHADFQRVFFGGDSAGGNIAHQMGLRVGAMGLGGAKLSGILLLQPYFWGTKRVGKESQMPLTVRFFAAAMWRFAYPTTSGSDDPYINPEKDPKLKELGCERVLVCVSELDPLKDRGWYYSESLRKSGWRGTVKVMESKLVGHVFQLSEPKSQQAIELMKNVAYFLNH